MPRYRDDPDRRDPATTLDLSSRVPTGDAGSTLVQYLASRFRYHSTATWRDEIADGRIYVDGTPGHTDQVVAAGAVVLYQKLHREPPIDRGIRILHEDAAVLIVHKPAHLPMHADGPFVRNTLIHLLRTEHGRPEANIVHRLDRETSGLLVVARTTAARRSLEQQFAAGVVQKTYAAVVHGVVAADFSCTTAIGHSATSTITLRRSAAATATNGKAAQTEFMVTERGPTRTLLRCRPRTGRTHQIRVHLEQAGYPLVGDKLYGRPDADYLAFVRRMKAGGDPRDTAPGEPSRQLLHATSLAFAHPETNAPVTFCSDIPAEFHEWLLAEA